MAGNGRIKHVGENFTIVPNSIINRSSISFRAKGIYMYLRSKPDNWEFNMKNIVSSSKEGRDAVQTAIQELVLAGYVERVANRNSETQRFDGWIWYIYNTPTQKAHEPVGNHRLPEKPSGGKPVRQEPRLTGTQAENSNTNYTNTDYNNTDNNNPENVVVEIFIENGIDVKPILRKDPEVFSCFAEKEIRKIAEALAKKQAQGKVVNPTGLLLSNPRAVAEAILAGKFYPEKKTKYDDVEIYVPPKI